MKEVSDSGDYERELETHSITVGVPVVTPVVVSFFM
jgi:hypothetical protein